MLRNKKFLIALAAILFILTAYFIYLLVTDSMSKQESETPNSSQIENQQEEGNESTDEGRAEQESEEQPQLPEGWISQESESYKYSVGVPDKWYFRFFGQTKMIGIDPNPIPEASEYAGVITLSQDDRVYDVLVSQLKLSLQNSSENSVVINEKEWLEIAGNLSEDDMFHPGKNYIHSVISVNGVSYLLTYSYETPDTNMLEIYKKVRGTVYFK